MSQVTWPLSGSSDSRGRSGDVFSLVGLSGARDGLLDLGGDIASGLSGLLGSLSLLLGDLLDLGSALSGLLLDLGRGSTLALDGVAEFGEGALLGGLLLTLDSGGRGLLALAESEGKRRLALLLDVLLGLGDSLSALSGSVVDLVGKRGVLLDGGDDRGGLSGGTLSRGLLSSSGGLSGSGLLLLLGEDVAEDAVALARLLLGALSGLILSSLLGGNSLSRGFLSGSGGSLSGSGLLSGGSGVGGRGSLLSLGLLLGDDILLAEAEERSTLAAGRATLGLLRLGLFLSSLLSSGALGGSFLSGGLLLSSLRGLLLLGGRLEALESLLVGLGLGDRGGELLGLVDLSLQLSNPVVTLSGVGSLESVLVAVGSEMELVRALSLGLGGVGLECMLEFRIFNGVKA